MGRKWVRLFAWAVLPGVLALVGSGCAFYDEMADQQDLRRVSGPAGTTTAAAPAYVRQDAGVDQVRQETAALRVEMNALHDNQRRMLTQIAEVQEALAARDKQVEELRGLVSVLESQLKVSDSEWQARMDKLRETMSVENKQRLDAMANRMATEMANTVQQVQQTSQGAAAGEHVVRQGDVLTVIAAAYGVSLQDLMRANNLSNDRIYVGQRLKIPAPRR